MSIGTSEEEMENAAEFEVVHLCQECSKPVQRCIHISQRDVDACEFEALPLCPPCAEKAEVARERAEADRDAEVYSALIQRDLWKMLRWLDVKEDEI